MSITFVEATKSECQIKARYVLELEFTENIMNSLFKNDRFIKNPIRIYPGGFQDNIGEIHIKIPATEENKDNLDMAIYE